MKRFARLFSQLDQTNSTLAKVVALKEYFDDAEPEDKLWTIALLSHKRPKRTVSTTLLRAWAGEQSGLPQWLFEESYHIVGDLAETIALVLPQPSESSNKSLSVWIRNLIAQKNNEESEKKTFILKAWNQLNSTERFVFNKLITGGFRMGVSQKLMVRALAAHTGIPENTLAHRLMGNWEPDGVSFDSLILESDHSENLSRPYPFFLAYGLETTPEALPGNPEDWMAEWKWDGIRGQIILRKQKIFVWTRGEELVTDKYPEFSTLGALLPDNSVLDGEILAYKDGRPMDFTALQTRIGRKNITPALLEKNPVTFMVYDILELDGKDIRDWPQNQRRLALERIFKDVDPDQSVLQLSELVKFKSWDELSALRSTSRARAAEGLMLKKKDGEYLVGRKKGGWWKWKVDPFTIDAVMIYAMRGHGRRANLYTDYTFAVWDVDQNLVPFTKAYSGLTDAEILEVDRFVKANTLERFGPVRSVKANLVFEIAFEGINKSTRHKSGVALRFPRIYRWRRDKPAEEAGTLDELKTLLNQYGNQD